MNRQFERTNSPSKTFKFNSKPSLDMKITQLFVIELPEAICCNSNYYKTRFK